MSDKASNSKATFAQVGGMRGLFRNPGLTLMTLRHGGYVGVDSLGNRYFQQHLADKAGRARRWVIYAGDINPSAIGPEWHAWLHYLTDQALPSTGHRPWQKEHQANLTGTVDSYRPAGHDYEGGKRARASGDYQSWSPDP